MANFFICQLFQRVILPIVLVTCAAFRPIGYSFIYLGFACALPYIPIARERKSNGDIFIILIDLIISKLL